MTSNSAASHGRVYSVACALLVIPLVACGSNTSNEKVDAGQRRYCDAACFDAISGQGNGEAGRTMDGGGVGPIDAGPDRAVSPDLALDLVAGETRFNDVAPLLDSGSSDATSDVTGGGLGGDGAGDSKESGGPDAAPDLPPDTGADTKDTPGDVPGPFLADAPPDMPQEVLADAPPDIPQDILVVAPVDVPGEPGPEGPPDVPPDAGDALVLLPDVPPDVPPDLPLDASSPSVCSINSSASTTWAKGWTGTANLPVMGEKGLVAGPDGSLWTTGQLLADFNFGSGTVSHGGGTHPTVFVAKSDPTTGLAMTNSAFGFANPSDLSGQASLGIAVASGGGGGANSNIGIVGTVYGEMDFTANYADGSGPTGNTGTAGVDFLNAGSPMQFYAVFNGTSSGSYITPQKAHMVDLGTGVLLSIASNPTQNAFAICGKTSKAVAKWIDTGANKGVITGGTGTGGAGIWGGGNYDLVVFKVDASTGAVIWGQEYGGVGDQVCESVAIDNSGNVIIAGTYFGSLFSLPTPGSNDLSGGTSALFLAKLNAADGSLGSAASWTVPKGSVSHAYALTVDGSGNTIMGGAIGSAYDFGTGAVTYAGLSDAFVAKFDSSLNGLWARSDGDATYDQYVKSVAVSSDGSVVIGGNFKGNLPYLGLTDSGNGQTDAFGAELSALDGSLLSAHCAHSYGDAPGAQSISVVSVARTGPLKDVVFVGGPFTSTITLGSTQLVSLGSKASCTPDMDGGGGCVGTQFCQEAGFCWDSSVVSYFTARLAP